MAQPNSKQTGTGKAAAKRAPAKGAVQKAPTKAPAKQQAPVKAPAKKAPVKKAPAKKATVKAPAEQAPAKQAPVKAPAAGPSSTDGTVAEAAVPAPDGQPASALVVRADEKPWTAAELAEVHGHLAQNRTRLRSEMAAVEQGIADLLRDSSEGAGSDQADVGATTLERDAEMSLANNARDMLFQIDRALARIDDGSYGVCESCGNPIGKQRLMVFPRATLCLTCKQREERR
ncbi:MAG: TraR/DksA C4-type zinc finger protein [Nocardioidaceae bacterium]